MLLLLVVIGAGCATRWEGAGVIRRFEDRVEIISVPRTGSDLGTRFSPLLARSTEDFLAVMRKLMPDWTLTSHDSIVVDAEAQGQPANFYVAARRTSIGDDRFSFIGSATVDGCERVRGQLLDASLTGGWRDGRCQPAVLTVG